MPKKVWYAPNKFEAFDEEEIEAVLACLRDGWLAPGPRTAEFEALVSAFFGKQHGIFCNSGSSANILALHMAGLKPGDEVITPACTFSTTVAPLCQLNLKPVFCDVEVRTFVPSVAQVMEKVTERTKALFIPNLAGSKPHWSALKHECEKIGRADIVLIEDSCDTMTYTRDSDISVISFYASHVITAGGGGGMVMCNNKDYLNTLIENTYKNFGFKNLIDFKEELKNNKISYELFLEKLKVDILWNQIIFVKYSDKIIINENDLKNQIQNQSTFITSFEIKEIVFSVTNVNDLDSVYQQIKKDINELGFENAAIKHSISNTAKSGGNIGWVDENQLNKEIIEKLNEIPTGSISNPIRIPGGFVILKKIDVKKVDNKLDFDQELSKLINYQKQTQLENYSNIYFNKVKKDTEINAP